MKYILKVIAVLVISLAYSSAIAASCKGKFPNPITDICWSCMFPMTIAGAELESMDQEDTDNPNKTVCSCSNPPMVGMTVSFWEPLRRVDVVRQPFCMSSLGGIQMDPGFDAPEAGRSRKDGQNKSSFYQVHWYVDPMVFYMQAVLDSNCLENQGFDLAYMTELDPMWKDDELTRIINPDVYLFGNLPARAACAADCVAATAGFPSNTLFWCAGCQGSLYPLNGNVQAHVGGVQASQLEVTRIIAKMHREGLMWAASGEDGMCGYYPQILMDKTNYKTQMLYPVPQTKKIQGKCCQPLGRSTILWGAGKEFPYEGEDFSYEVFRKRNCCQAAPITP